MDRYKTERGKFVQYKGTTVAVHEDGGVSINVMARSGSAEDIICDLTEDEVSILYGLLADVTHWDHTTTARQDRAADEPE